MSEIMKLHEAERKRDEEHCNALCALAAKHLNCDWNDFEVEYLSENSVMVRLDSNKVSYLIERL